MCIFTISSMCTVSGMLSVIACALPSITGMGVFTFSLLFLVKKLVLSFAQRKGENFFVFQKMPLTSAFSLSLFHTLNMHNKLSRKRLRRGLDGEQETSYLPSRKTIKTDSTDLSKSVTPPGPTLGKWETLHSHKTQHPCKRVFGFLGFVFF